MNGVADKARRRRSPKQAPRLLSAATA